MVIISTKESLEEVNKKISEASDDSSLFLNAYSVGENDLERLRRILDAVSQYLTDNYQKSYN